VLQCPTRVDGTGEGPFVGTGPEAARDTAAGGGSPTGAAGPGFHSEGSTAVLFFSLVLVVLVVYFCFFICFFFLWSHGSGVLLLPALFVFVRETIEAGRNLEWNFRG